jgi:hypothetical protein
MYYKRILIPVYDQWLYLIISEDVEKEITEIQKKYDPNLDRFDFAGFSGASAGSNLLLLNIKYLPSELLVVSTIAHEAFHISNYVFKRVGAKVDVDNDESQAYLISWLVEFVYSQYVKFKKEQLCQEKRQK